MPRAQASRATSVDSAGTTTASTTATAASARAPGPGGSGRRRRRSGRPAQRAAAGALSAEALLNDLVEGRPADRPGPAEERPRPRRRKAIEVADAADRRSCRGPPASISVGTTPRTTPAMRRPGEAPEPADGGGGEGEGDVDGGLVGVGQDGVDDQRHRHRPEHRRQHPGHAAERGRVDPGHPGAFRVGGRRPQGEAEAGPPQEKAVSTTPTAAATRRVTTSLRATWRSPSRTGLAGTAGAGAWRSDPHTTLTPARRGRADRGAPRGRGRSAPAAPGSLASQTRPRPAATTTATARAGHQPRPDPTRPSGAMRSPWRTAATVPMATMATLGTRAA